MNELDINRIEKALRGAPVEVITERRAFGSRRGVPDVVAWLSPGHDGFPDRTLPMLLELEGSFSGAATDFEQFAGRYLDPELQYHLEWPAAAENISPMQRTCTYDIAGVPARRLGRGFSVSEGTMYEILTDWFDEFRSMFERRVQVREYGETTAVIWELKFRMYGHEFSSSIHYFTEVGSDFRTVVKSYISPPTIPCAVIINGEYGPKVSTVSHHETVIEFPVLRAIRFRPLNQ